MNPNYQNDFSVSLNDESPGKILIVDDNEEIIILTSKFLKHHGFEIICCGDGETALTMCEELKPDVVLLDVMLPKIDGLEVCKRLKAGELTRKIMVLLLTGCGTLNSRVKGLEAGADDYITKPFHVSELLARVRSALRIKKLTEEIEQSHLQLLESHKDRLRSEKMATIGLLATGIAHEFNNIMSGISGFAQLAKKNPEYQEKLVDVTMTQAKRAMEIANSLSTFYRPSAGKSEVSLKEIIDNALLLITKEVKEREIDVETQIDPDIKIWAHAGQIQEVILNFFLNAIHAMGKTGKLSIRLFEIEGEAQLEIEDTGGGIPEEVLEKIFDPFFTTKGALGGGGGCGSGLGLSVSYNILTSHRGTVKIDNNPPKGVCFIIKLPLSKTIAEGLEKAESSAKKNGNLLIGDSDHSIHEIADKYLKGTAGECYCSNWDQLWEELEGNSIDTVLIDLNLEGDIPFEESFTKLVTKRPELSIILTSDNLSHPNLSEYLSHCCGHLLKPYTVENLTNLVEL